jgi:hypothetical protein
MWPSPHDADGSGIHDHRSTDSSATHNLVAAFRPTPPASVYNTCFASAARVAVRFSFRYRCS